MRGTPSSSVSDMFARITSFLTTMINHPHLPTNKFFLSKNVQVYESRITITCWSFQNFQI